MPAPPAPPSSGERLGRQRTLSLRLRRIGADAERGVLRSDPLELGQRRSPIHGDVRARARGEL
jgi:hypothetical protein